MSPTPREVFLRLVHGVADGRVTELPDLYAEVTDVRHPMATPEAEALTSREQLRAHFSMPPDDAPPVPKRRVVDVRVHETTDPEVIVAEFAYEFIPEDAPAVKVPAVFVLRVRDGEIVESRDYIDPIRRAVAGDATDALIASIRE